MDGNYKPYSHVTSSDRIKSILDQPAGSFEETDSLPDRDKLTFTNGFYSTCSAIFIDVRDSSGLTAKYKRPTLAKIYRAFISEMVAVLNSIPNVREVSIVGDCVWAVYNTPFVSDITQVFDVACRANTLLRLLNHHYAKKNIGALQIGIGVDDGRALMIKAGFSGSGINDVVYMGDVVNSAAHLAHEAGRGRNPPIYVGGVVYVNLPADDQKLLSSKHLSGHGTVYVGEVVSADMNDYVDSLT
ncbi:adenylate/guanylate cyclase domain-containing protein [Microbacterium aurum]|uniref:Adenylate/guanylate cyclase domain-containing protein n=1 Tax=Microbacterium aurum TaxID=36805 RepID=A0A1P8U771_9MICO|nr:adenylate/guanylate cyclase domain-containing protein [Microbacterium aurum]APZ33944.1 adenylate/guanylate cyclase domain-containing protein [Microbacterium aurum]MBM7827709.1 class 3 adenylate cyclase [Microbacterium aurum]